MPQAGPPPVADVGPPHDGVRCAGVTRSFGQVRALRGVDLDARPGEVTGLVGPNGAGKTTLLLVLGTLLRADGGTVHVAGHDPADRPDDVRARLGWMPDGYGLYESVTCRETLELVGRAYRLDRATARERAAALLAEADLEPYADTAVHVLSRGQKQRLGLARALVHRPSVLLLDEPAAGLDPRARVRLRERLRELARSGVAVLVSSHVLADLEEVADAVCVVDRGRTVAQGRLDELRGGSGDAPQVWRLRSLDRPRLVPALRRAGAEVSGVGPGGVDVLLTDERAAADLLAALVAAGVPVTGCAPLTGALESAFLSLTDADPRQQEVPR